MTDIKKENKILTPAAPAAHLQAAPVPPPQTEEKPPAPAVKSEMSKGEKIYNWSVYSGVNYWVNLVSSIAIADYFINLSGKTKLDGLARKMGNAFSSAGMGAAENAFKNSRTALQTLVLLSGGWLLLVPMKIAEDNKRPIVHWLNKKMGVDQTAPDGHEETPQEIYIEQEQPRQSWPHVIFRRVLATAAVMGVGQTINAVMRDRKSSAGYKGEEDIHGGKAVVERFIVDNVNRFAKWSKLPGSDWFLNSRTAQAYLGLAALDTFFTKITATIMHMTNGAKKAHMIEEISIDVDPEGVARENEIILLRNRRNEAAPQTGRKHTDAIKPRAETAQIQQTAPSSLSEKITAQRQASEQHPAQIQPV